jgi:4-amino-4-deoxy-L-arabinose transferase-like glycosyltransferase
MTFLGAGTEKVPASDLVLAALVVVGMTTRMINLNQSLSVDEAWVANSVLTDSLHGMFYYDNWLQTSPPLFLLLVRFTARVFGASNAALRVVPSCFGMLSIMLMAMVARRLFAKASAILCVALLITSAEAYHWAIILKQYSSDLFVSLLLFWLLLRYVAEPRRRNYVFLVCGFAVAVSLSYTAVFFVPGAVYALLYHRWHAPNPGAESPGAAVSRAAVFLLLIATGVALIFVIFIRPNQSPELAGWWFPDRAGGSSVLASARSYLAKSEYLASALVLPARFQTARWAGVLDLVIGIGIVRLAIMALRRESAQRHFFVVSSLLFLGVIGSDRLRQYPYGVDRLSLFLLPAFILCIGAALEALRDGVMEGEIAERASVVSGAVLQAVCVTAVAVFLFVHVLRYAKPEFEEDAEAAVRYVMVNAGPGDLVYVHASMFEQFKFYRGRMRGREGVEYYYGNTGWRCCSRRHASYFTEREDASALRTDLDAFLSLKAAGTRWFLFIDRPGDWYWRDDPKFVKGALESAKCVRSGGTAFRGALIVGYRCEG